MAELIVNCRAEQLNSSTLGNEELAESLASPKRWSQHPKDWMLENKIKDSRMLCNGSLSDRKPIRNRNLDG